MMTSYVKDSVIGIRCHAAPNCPGYRKVRYTEIVNAHENGSTLSLIGCSHPKTIGDAELKEIHRQLHSAKKLWERCPKLMETLDRMFGL